MNAIVCDRCGDSPKKALATRLPPKWKRWTSGVWCPSCVKNGFALTAIELPIAEPLGWSHTEDRSGDWLPLVWSFPNDPQDLCQELARALDPWLTRCWHEATTVCNWAVTQLVANDVLPPGATECPPNPKVYLYGIYNAADDRSRPSWDGGCHSLQATFKAVSEAWGHARFDVLWRRNRVAQTYTYPQPFRLHKDSFRCTIGAGGELLFTCRLPNVAMPGVVTGVRKTGTVLRTIVRQDGGWVRLRLAGGEEWRRQRERFLQIVHGCAEHGEAAIIRKRVAPSSRNRHTHSDHKAPGSGHANYRTFIKIAGYFRLPQYTPTAKELVVVTQPDCMWMATIDGVKVWQENGDHMRCRIIAHGNYLHRTSQELKYERRHNVDRERIEASRSERCRKHHNRLKSFMEMSTAAIVGLAVRRRCHLIRYTDTDRSSVPSFPWRGFRDLLQRKALAASLQFHGHTLAEGEENG